MDRNDHAVQQALINDLKEEVHFSIGYLLLYP